MNLALVLGLVWPRLAAAEPSRFALVQKDCPALDEGALRELVELELRTLSVSDTAARIGVTCSEGTALVSLTDGHGRAYPIASRVDFSRAGPGARERLVALAATELVAQADRRGATDRAGPDATGSDGTASDDATVSSSLVADAASDAPVAPEHAPVHGSRRDAEVGLGPVVTVLGSPTTLLVGGAVTARFRLGGPWALAFDARVERGTSNTEVANVTWTAFGGSAAVLVEQRFGAARLGIGAGVRAARVTLDAAVKAPDTGHALSGAWAGPVLPLRAAFALVAPLVLVATAEAGYVTFPLRGTLDGGDRVVSAEGPWVSLGIGVAAAF